MKNIFLFATIAFLMVGCISNELKKTEINEKITQLNKQIANLTDQRSEIKEQREDLIVKLKESITRDLSEVELYDIETNYQKQMKWLEIRENKIKITILKDKLEIEKLTLRLRSVSLEN